MRDGRFSPGQCVAFPGDNARTGTSHKAGLLVLQRGVGLAGLGCTPRYVVEDASLLEEPSPAVRPHNLDSKTKDQEYKVSTGL